MTARKTAGRSFASLVAGTIVVGDWGLAPAMADGRAYPPVADPIVAKECGACHMRYPPGLLPARAWTALVEGLPNHFGENASLDPVTAQAVLAYLAANGATASRRSWWGGSVETATGPVAMRITEQDWFKREHGPRRLSPDRLARRGARSPSDCAACHRGAEAGLFDDD